jgi:aryl-alcohol dehydrogenase-like predicted oxidoreductase
MSVPFRAGGNQIPGIKTVQIRRLGRTNIEISVLSIGGLYTSSLAGGAAEATRILQRAGELGINAIDTAPAYADSEWTIGQVLRNCKQPLILTTKLGGRPQPFDPQDIRGLRFSVDESLRLLRRECIDVLMIHEPDRPQQYAWWTNCNPLNGPVLELMEELKQAGKIRFSGLAGTTVTELTSLVASDLFDVVLTAFNYNTLFREAERELISAAMQRDMGIVLGSVLGQGFLGRRFDDFLHQKPIWLAESRRQQLLAYYRLLDETRLSPVQMGIRFAISNPNISTLPIGCKTVQQLEESVASANEGPLPNEILDRLNQIAAMLPFRPFEEPMILPLGKSYQGPGMANLGAAVPVGKMKL